MHVQLLGKYQFLYCHFQNFKLFKPRRKFWRHCCHGPKAYKRKTEWKIIAKSQTKAYKYKSNYLCWHRRVTLYAYVTYVLLLHAFNRFRKTYFVVFSVTVHLFTVFCLHVVLKILLYVHYTFFKVTSFLKATLLTLFARARVFYISKYSWKALKEIWKNSRMKFCFVELVCHD